VVGLVNPYIEDHEKSLDPKNSRDFLDVLLSEQKTGQEGISSLSGPLGKFTILNSLIDLFVAGMETTSSSLVMAILQLLHHPDVQHKVHQELDRVCLSDSIRFDWKLRCTVFWEVQGVVRKIRVSSIFVFYDQIFKVFSGNT